MDEEKVHLPPSRSENWRERWQRIKKTVIKLIPFTTGIAATLVGFYIYNAIKPPPEPLTVDQVKDTVAQAMAEATPARAFSAQVYQVIQPSLVLISTSGSAPNGTHLDGLGSGVVVTDIGQILTAYHVVEDATEIKVFFADGTETSAQLESSQPENDIAVLMPDHLPDILVPAVMGNPNALSIGDEAYAVGNPFGLYGSMSSGVISGFDRTFKAEDSPYTIEGLIQIDSAVNPGNSGGPLLNRFGQVVGIVIGILNPTDDEFFVGIGFAVPISTAGGAAGMPLY